MLVTDPSRLHAWKTRKIAENCVKISVDLTDPDEHKLNTSPVELSPTRQTGSPALIWQKKDVADLKMDHVYDFEMGVDRLDLRNFVKGRGVQGAKYSDVVQLDHVDAGSLSLKLMVYRGIAIRGESELVFWPIQMSPAKVGF